MGVREELAADAAQLESGGRLRIAKLTPPIPGEIGEAAVVVEW